MTYPASDDIYGGYCQLHHQTLPCHSCTSAPQPQFIPVHPYAPPVNPLPGFDPWMPGSPSLNLSPIPIPPLYGFRFVPSVCDHCFCEYHEADTFGGVQTTPDHEGCCNCGTRRAISPLSHHVTEHVLDDLRDAGVDHNHVEWDHDAFLDD